jgi:hypothetical protein
MTVSYFRDFESNYQPNELAIFERAYEGACHKLGMVSAPSDPNDNKGTRDQLAAAIVYAARLGEREVAVLAAAAVAAAVRYRHAPRR